MHTCQTTEVATNTDARNIIKLNKSHAQCVTRVMNPRLCMASLIPVEIISRAWNSTAVSFPSFSSTISHEIMEMDDLPAAYDLLSI